MYNPIMAKTSGNDFYNVLKRVRNFWTLNPRTRIRDNPLRNIKKRRREDKLAAKDPD